MSACSGSYETRGDLTRLEADSSGTDPTSVPLGPRLAHQDDPGVCYGLEGACQLGTCQQDQHGHLRQRRVDSSVAFVGSLRSCHHGCLRAGTMIDVTGLIRAMSLRVYSYPAAQSCGFGCSSTLGLSRTGTATRPRRPCGPLPTQPGWIASTSPPPGSASLRVFTLTSIPCAVSCTLDCCLAHDVRHAAAAWGSAHVVCIGNPYSYWVYGAAVSEVETDTLTGNLSVWIGLLACFASFTLVDV